MIGSCVYMMVADVGAEHSFCKIGITGDLGKRIAGIQTGCPVPIVDVAYISALPYSARQIEGYLHAQLEEFHTHGEWFRLNLKDKDHKAKFHLATRFALYRVGMPSAAKWKRLNPETVKFACKALRLDEAA